VSCEANLCYARYIPDTACADTTTCPSGYDSYCGPFQAGPANDCVYDFCTINCCTTSDCAPSTTGDRFVCVPVVYPWAGDLDVCLYTASTGTKAPGDPCASGTECRSGYCSSTGVCRERCCTDADCGGATPRCGLESLPTQAGVRLVEVCLP
jgi:hypothetical protein